MPFDTVQTKVQTHSPSKRRYTDLEDSQSKRSRIESYDLFKTPEATDTQISQGINPKKIPEDKGTQEVPRSKSYFHTPENPEDEMKEVPEYENPQVVISEKHLNDYVENTTKVHQSKSSELCYFNSNSKAELQMPQAVIKTNHLKRKFTDEDTKQKEVAVSISYFNPDAELQTTQVIISKHQLEDSIKNTPKVYQIESGDFNLEPKVQNTPVVNEEEKLTTSLKSAQEDKRSLKRKFSTDKDTKVQKKVAEFSTQKVDAKTYTANQEQNLIANKLKELFKKDLKEIFEKAITKQYTAAQMNEVNKVLKYMILKAFRKHRLYLDEKVTTNPYGFKKTGYGNKGTYYISEKRTLILPLPSQEKDAGRDLEVKYKGQECIGFELTADALQRGKMLTGTPDEVIEAIEAVKNLEIIQAKLKETPDEVKKAIEAAKDWEIIQANFKVDKNLLLSIDHGLNLERCYNEHFDFFIWHFKKVLEVIKKCHLNKMYHLDLKPRNMTKDKNDKIWIVDLGSFAFNGKIPTCSGTAYYQPKELFAALSHDAFHENEILNTMRREQLLNKGELCFGDRFYKKTDTFIIELVKKYPHINHGLYDALAPIFTHAEFLSTLTGPAATDTDLINSVHKINICDLMQIEESAFTDDNIPNELLDREKVKNSLREYKYFNENKFNNLPPTFTIEEFLATFNIPAYNDLIGPAEEYAQVSDEYALAITLMELTDAGYELKHEARGIKLPLNPHIEEWIKAKVKTDYHKQFTALITSSLNYNLWYGPDRVHLADMMIVDGSA